MSTFNVHEWNRKRRLNEIGFGDDKFQSSTKVAGRKADAVTALVDAIELAKESGVINRAQELILDQVAASLIKKMARERGDLNEQEFVQLDKRGVDLESNRPIAWVPEEDYLRKAELVGEWNGSSYEIGGTNYYCVIFNSKEQLHTYNYVQGHPIYGTMGNEVRVPENYG
jgi:hypothetical protein